MTRAGFRALRSLVGSLGGYPWGTGVVWTTRRRPGSGGSSRRGRRLPKLGLRPVGEELAQLKAMHSDLMRMAAHERMLRALGLSPIEYLWSMT